MNSRLTRIAFCLILLVKFNTGFPQTDSTSIDKKKINRFVLSTGVIYTGSLFILNQAWYKNDDREKFHFFNDNKEWNQMDKVGHAWTSYQLTRVTESVYKKAGFPHVKSYFLGVLTSFALMTPIEILDGYSSAYGASLGDIGANLSGSAIYGINSLILKDQILGFKFSFQRSGLAELRPDVLGKNAVQEILKDYNGQTYWLTVNLNKTIHSSIPSWLQLAVGYGAENMIHANEDSNLDNGYASYRQLYLSLDIHLPKLIKSDKAWVNSLLNTISVIHLPAPALEFGKGGKTFHLLKM